MNRLNRSGRRIRERNGVNMIKEYFIYIYIYENFTVKPIIIWN